MAVQGLASLHARHVVDLVPLVFLCDLTLIAFVEGGRGVLYVEVLFRSSLKHRQIQNRKIGLFEQEGRRTARS